MFWQKCSLKVDYDVGETYFYFSTLSQDFALGASGAVITTTIESSDDELVSLCSYLHFVLKYCH